MRPRVRFTDQKKRIKNKKPIKNRKNKQKKYYSGKAKRHTIKTQVIADKDTKRIICTDFCEGRKHDFKLFKDSKTEINERILLLDDTGYLGITELHSNNLMPKKKSKKKPLTKKDKENNREISRQRVVIENIICMIKRYKILCEKYRNRRKRFGLRFNLLAGIYNFELSA